MKIDLERTIFDILWRKQAFLGYENIGLKKPGNLIVPKGLVHGFGHKFSIFSTFRFMQNAREKVFGDVLVRKEPFLDHKNMDLRKP